MARSNPSPLVIADLTGGRNGFDSSINIPDDQCVEALNIDFSDGGMGGKRNGATALSLTFSSGGPFANALDSLVRHVPADNETAAEFWAFDATAPVNVGRLAASTQWVTPTTKDTFTNGGVNAITGASIGGLFFITGKHNGGNRLSVWDVSLSKVRRVGLATPATPTTTPDGAGALSFTRFHAVRWVDISGSDTRRRSERSGSVSTTISAKSGITVNRPTLAGEDETHWEVLASATGVAGTWYRLSQVAAATTTYDDTAATIPTTTLDASDGINFPPPSAKFIIKVGPRLMMANAWETTGGFVTPKNNRVWWSAVIGSNDIGDLERIPTGFYQDVGSPITGLGGPILGSVYVFSYRRIWKLVPTGLPGANAFELKDLVDGIGCISHASIMSGEDENGNPALYFWSHRGPYRIGIAGLQYLGRDVEDVTSGINLGASVTPAHGVYHSDVHQIWWWIATGSSAAPDTKLVFHTLLGESQQGGIVRKGWAKHTGLSAAVRCSALFSNTVGATMSRDLKPYAGSTALVKVYKCDSTAKDDDGTAFQAYDETKDYAFGGLGTNAAVNERHLLARPSPGVTITCSAIRDAGVETITSTVSLTAVGSETVVQRKFESGEIAGAGLVRFRIGDASAVSNGWILDAFVANYTGQEPR